MHVRVLAALVTIRPRESCAAVEALRLMRVPVLFAGLRLHRAGNHAARQRIADRFEIAHSYPRERH